MDLRVEEYQLPSEIGFNFEELKNELAARIEQYNVTVYTDDLIKDAKKDKANLNRLDKALNDERIRRQKEYMKPFDDFKAKIDELRAIIKEPVALIDARVSEYEEKKKAEKAAQIESLYESKNVPEWLTIDRIWNEKWLNASVSMNAVESDIDGLIEQAVSQYHSLEILPNYSLEACECYKKTLSIQQALAEVAKLTEYAKAREEAEKRKAEMERIRAEEEARLKAEAEAKAKEQNPDVDIVPTSDEKPVERKWLAFWAYVSKEQAHELSVAMHNLGIPFEAIWGLQHE